MNTECARRTVLAHHRPTTLDEALRLLREIPGARLVAGGTDIFVHVRCGRVPAPPALVSLRRIPGLCGVTIGDTVEIGALTTVAELAAHRELCALIPALASAARDFAGPQVRNAATVAGNLCTASPCASLAPPLLAHDARVVARGASGEREIELLRFFVAPGQTLLGRDEVVTAVRVPRPDDGTRSAFRRAVRVAMDVAFVSVAAAVRMEKGACAWARVVAGAVAPTPLRLCDVEELLVGSRLDDATLSRAGELAAAGVAPITDIRATAEYRRHMTGVLLRRALAGLAEGGTDRDA